MMQDPAFQADMKKYTESSQFQAAKSQAEKAAEVRYLVHSLNIRNDKSTS